MPLPLNAEITTFPSQFLTEQVKCDHKSRKTIVLFQLFSMPLFPTPENIKMWVGCKLTPLKQTASAIWYIQACSQVRFKISREHGHSHHSPSICSCTSSKQSHNSQHIHLLLRLSHHRTNWQDSLEILDREHDNTGLSSHLRRKGFLSTPSILQKTSPGNKESPNSHQGHTSIYLGGEHGGTCLSGQHWEAEAGRSLRGLSRSSVCNVKCTASFILRKIPCMRKASQARVWPNHLLGLIFPSCKKTGANAVFSYLGKLDS